ncbi:MAG: sugar transferase [Sphingomonadales bacterium]|nr:MAG: sugar transferase [Sphingomonadales bacterium]
MDRAARLFEIALAALMLVLTMPLLLAAAFAIWLGDGGAPIYLAPRVGRSGSDFHMLKLRTMVPEADRLVPEADRLVPEADRLGGQLAPVGDPRITTVGTWLRRWKLDELLQLWNVLRGEMRLVGPRPDVREGVALYSPEEL